MINRFISSLPAFTLESLVNNGRWTAAQIIQRKKGLSKSSAGKKAELLVRDGNKDVRTAL